MSYLNAQLVASKNCHATELAKPVQTE